MVNGREGSMIRKILCNLAFLLIAGLSFSIGSKGADAKIIGAWLFNEESKKIAKDSSENKNNGEIVGDPQWVKGKFDKALKFDGSDDHIDIPKPTPEILQPETLITMMAWVKPDRIQRDWDIIISMQKGTTWSNTYSIDIGSPSTPGKIGVIINDVRINDPEEITSGSWYHVAATYNGSKIILYKEGETVAEKDYAGPLQYADGGRLVINGNYNSADGGLGEFVEGIIDEVVLLDEALTADEIKNFMEKGLKNIIVVSPSGKLAQTWGELKASH